MQPIQFHNENKMIVDEDPPASEPLAIEYKMNVCTLCSTPTQFSDYKKLEKHVTRFHSAFNQNIKGSKRKKLSQEVFPKKLRWE